MAIIWLILLFIGLAMIIFAAHLFIRYSSRLLIIHRAPPLMTGMYLAALSSAIPELVIALLAYLYIPHQLAAIIVGTAVGGGIALLLLGLGITALRYHALQSPWEMLRIDIPLFAMLSALFIFTAWDYVISRLDGIILLVGYCSYLWYTSHLAKDTHSNTRPQHSFSLYGYVLLTLLALFIGGLVSVRSVTALALDLNLPHVALLSLTIIASALLIPKYICISTAARQHHQEATFGYLLSSYVTPLLLVCGLASLLTPLIIPPIVLRLAFPFLIAALSLVAFSMLDKRISNYEGLLLVLLYAIYLITLFRL